MTPQQVVLSLALFCFGLYVGHNRPDGFKAYRFEVLTPWNRLYVTETLGDNVVVTDEGGNIQFFFKDLQPAMDYVEEIVYRDLNITAGPDQYALTLSDTIYILDTKNDTINFYHLQMPTP